MKKIFLAIVILCIAQQIQAQVDIGIKGGVNIANLSGDDIDGNSRIGANLGIYYEYYINDRISIQPEILYSMQGAKFDKSYTEEGVTYQEEGDIKLDYINVPILAKFYATEDLYLLAGPQVGFNINAKAEYTQRVTSDIQELNSEETYEGDLNDINTFDFAITLGAGFRFIEDLGAEVRYNVGITELGDEFEAKNSVVQVGVFYMF